MMSHSRKSLIQEAKDRAELVIAAAHPACPGRQEVAAALMGAGGRAAAQVAASRIPHSPFRSALLRALRIVGDTPFNGGASTAHACERASVQRGLVIGRDRRHHGPKPTS